MSHPILLVIDAERPTLSVIRAVERFMVNNKGVVSELHLLAFVDDPGHTIFDHLCKCWPGQVHLIDTASYLEATAGEVRREILELVAGLGTSLRNAAAQVSAKWSQRFDERWWYTEISEKNTPGNQFWWTLFRLAVVDQRLSEIVYDKCVFVGSNLLMRLLVQACQLRGLTVHSQILDRYKSTWLKLLVKRMLGGVSLLLVVVSARREFGHQLSQVLEKRKTTKRLLAYTSFPRSWTSRNDAWQDMYYGSLLEAVKNTQEIQPVYVLVVHENLHARSPWSYRDKLKRVHTLDPLRPYVVLEALGSPWVVVRAYARVWDIICYWRVTRSGDHKKAVKWRGIDVSPLLSLLMWRSILLSWPYLEALEKQVQKITDAVKPAVVLLYKFESVYGRAIIQATRQAATKAVIIGMQHGPITPMKLQYSGLPEELRDGASQTAALPQPDVYAVDGPLAQSVLSERGIPYQVIERTGPARFDAIWPKAVAATTRPRFTHQPIQVLVAPSLHDTEFVLQFVLSALAGDSRLLLVFKLHPKCPKRVRTLIDSHVLLKEYDGTRLRIVQQRDIYHWMERSDLFLSTYSSTGVEAVAFGLPVILLLSHRMPDVSVFSHKDSPVLKASDPKMLRDHVNLLIKDEDWRRQYLKKLSHVLMDSFGQTDSHATDRLVSLCLSASRGEFRLRANADQA